MSAKVLGSGQVREMIDSNYIEAAPQVHLHFLTDDTEYAQLGYGKLEICCHGCGEAMLIYYNDDDPNTASHMGIRDGFTAKHHECKNRRFEEECPTYRSKVTILDMRKHFQKPSLRSQTHRVSSDKGRGRGTSSPRKQACPKHSDTRTKTREVRQTSTRRRTP